MAKVSDGFAAKRQTMAINGVVRPSASGAVDLVVRIDGNKRSWQVRDTTPHAATYAAAISALIDADAAGVTHLTLQTPANLVRRQATGEWEVESSELQRLRLLYEILRVDFDDVDWIKGPA